MKTKSLESVAQYAMAAHWIKFCELFPKLKKCAVPTLTLNERLYKTAAYAYMTENRIEFSAKYLRQHRDTMLNIILPHELAHLIDIALNGPSRFCHGKKWQAIMLAYGLPADRFHNMELTK